ncbi:DNA helicase PIF1, ATP-dependent [Senna tora]|uniref:ATP-dependent DNA helicase n=1 Tax=Senna tora TaxID=362788 RepID=A0A834SZ83_9FABA|nr:DNA helicase PIF1, ATP-dependent [Senna tora]
MQGKVVLPPARKPPNLLEKLLTRKYSRSDEFMNGIRNNNMFVFTSMGGKVDHTINNDEPSKFSQLYIYDTDNEVLTVFEVQVVMEQLRSSNAIDLRLKLTTKCSSDARTYNLPTASEVADLIVGDFDMERGLRDIIVQNISGLLQRIDELHPLYLPMQYPLLFPYGEDGYHEDTLYKDGSISEDRKQRHLTMRQKFAYKLQDRRNEFNMILRAKKLTQQFTVDAFTMIEAHPIYRIEFQKHGLPNAHILIWLAPKDKLSTSSHINYIVFAKIPSPMSHAALYEAVKSFMIHGPCGAARKTLPCMINGKCSKHFPKKFTDRTSFDDDFYAKYRRRDIGNTVVKNGIELDNRFVVPYNPTLLLRYQTHINIDFCNQSRSINNASLKQTKFLAWFKANKIRPIAITYAQMPTKFVFKTNRREWCIRKSAHSIGRLYYVAPDLQLDDDRIKDISLAEIESILRTKGRSLRDFPPMPLPNDFLMYNTENMLMTALRCRGDIVLAVPLSRIASRPILDGRTAHSRFAIPLECNENSTCNIQQGSDLGNLLINTKLIIWEEAPMPHRGSRQDIVLSAINSSYVWDSCKILTLTKNIRLGTHRSDDENQAITEFADWILKAIIPQSGGHVEEQSSSQTAPLSEGAS